MPAVSTRSRRVKKESPVPEIDEPPSDDIKKSRPSRKKKEILDDSVAEVDAREKARTPAGKRQAAKRKQPQDEEPEEDGDENESKRRRTTRKSNVVAEVKQNEPMTPRNPRAKKAKAEEEAASPVPKFTGRKSSAPKAKSAVEPEKKSATADDVDGAASNGRARRASARKSSAVLMDFDPEEESETDFSDNDDDDFVLPESEKSEEEEAIPEGDLEPEPSVAPTKSASRKVASTRAKSKMSRSDKIREFLLDVDQSAPPELAPKNESKAAPKSESKATPKKAEKPSIPAKVQVTAKSTPNRSAKATRSAKASEEESLSSDESDESPPPKSRKASRTARATPSTKDRRKRPRLSSEDSNDSLMAPKKAKSVRTPKVSMKNRKTFMKPRKIAIQKSDDETPQDGSSIDASLFEKSLLKLAKRMDDKEESENSEVDGEDKPEEQKDGDLEEAGGDESKEATSKPDSEAEAQTEADKKLLILSMLKEHEPVDDMSDGSSDEDDQPKKETTKTEANKTKIEPVAEVKEVKIESVKAEENGADEKKTKRKEVKTSEIKSAKSPKKGAAKKKGAIKAEQAEVSSDSEDENWEVVEDAAIRDPNYKRPDNVTVVLQAEDFISDGKKGLTMEQRMIRLINRRRRGVALYSHRVHLLSLIAYHRWLNSIIESDHVKAFAVSVLPSSLAMPGKSRNEPKMIQQLLTLYEKDFELLPSDEAFVPRKLKGNLLRLLAHKKTYCNITYLFGLITLLRACGIRARLCLSYRLTSHKAVQLRVKDGEMYEVGAKTKGPGTGTGIDDYFVEVYFSDKKRWRPIDIDNFTVIEDPQDLNPHLEQPVSHLIGIDGKACMVDLSPKYNADWLNRMKTLRGDPKFFEEVLQRYAPEEKEQIEEKKEVATKHNQQGLPKVISEYKNHPKYALRRHLLKHEAFYPREPPILGEIRGEPVYPRENVFLLHSRDQWYRKARSVKEGEEPYNVVTARPKFDRRKEVWVKDLPMEIFGEWQTERFKPPVVVDGKIPRNKYGNVDLFHPDMLPIGAAHVKLPMLNRVAADLGVDCVPAVIGFDGLGRAFHAVFEGYVVCEEDKEALEKAWHERQHEDRHTRRERARTRAVRNWKILVKKVIWDLRLKKKYKSNLEQEQRS